MSSIRAVAEAAGVSKTTVSFVMNNTHPQVDRIPEETRERIRGIAAALGYQGNPIAASIRTGKRPWIGVMTEVLQLDPRSWRWAPFFEVSLVYGIQRELADHGYFTLLGLRHREDEVQDIEVLGSAKIGGLILKAPQERVVQKAEGLLATGVPVVNVFPRQSSHLFPYTVDLDNIAAGRLAAEIVIQAGSKNPACVGVLDHSEALHARQAGWAEKIRKELGVVPGVCELPLKPGGDPERIDSEGAIKALRSFINTNRPDSLVAVGGGTSMMLTVALESLPVEVPRDLSIVGFDAFVVGNTKFRTMSSVGVSWCHAGEVAAHIIVELVETGTSRDLPRLLQPLFLPGDSTPPDLDNEFRVSDLADYVSSKR